MKVTFGFLAGLLTGVTIILGPIVAVLVGIGLEAKGADEARDEYKRSIE